MPTLTRASSGLHVPPKHTVIVGAGIVGAATAYYLARHPLFDPASHRITILESSAPAAGASGKSGGFLAANWHASETASLGLLSFGLHAELAAEHAGAERWGYRRVDTLSVQADLSSSGFDDANDAGRDDDRDIICGGDQPPPATAGGSAAKKALEPWLARAVTSRMSLSKLGSTSTCAQVTPGLLTTALLELTPEARIVKAAPTELIRRSNKGELTGVRYSGTGIEQGESGELEGVTAVVLANGPWLGRLATDLLGPKIGDKLDVDGQKAHSVVFRIAEEAQSLVTAHALFTSLTFPSGEAADPEVYPRSDGTVYLCGSTSSALLPELASEVEPDDKPMAELVAHASALSPLFSPIKGGSVERRQACFLPSASRGRPLIGKVPGAEGVWVGGGLSCWGITLGPGTGKLLAEGILEGKMYSADVRRLAP